MAYLPTLKVSIPGCTEKDGRVYKIIRNKWHGLSRVDEGLNTLYRALYELDPARPGTLAELMAWFIAGGASMTESAVLQIETKFDVIYCCECKMSFAVPADIRSRWLNTPTWFYCPQGHKQHYTDTEVQRLKKQLAEAQENAQSATKRKEWAEQEARNARANEAVERDARHKVEKKLKRVKNGVCPCCTQSFTNLRRHIATKHPEFSAVTP